MTQLAFDEPTFTVALLQKDLIAAKDAARLAVAAGERTMLDRIIGLLDGLLDEAESPGELMVLNNVLVAVEQLLPEEERR